MSANYDYARGLLVQECLGGFGIRFEVAPVDIHADGPETANRHGRRLFDEDLAARYGYHPAPTDRFDRDEAQRASLQQLPDEEYALLEQCREESYADLPLLKASIAESLSFGLNVDGDPQVVEAASRWVECMDSAGYPDVAQTPREMPPTEFFEAWGLGEANPSAESPQQEEVLMAVADARCRRTSGYSDLRYEAEWDVAALAVDQNRRQFEEERIITEQTNRAIERVVERLGSDSL